MNSPNLSGFYKAFNKAACIKKNRSTK